MFKNISTCFDYVCPKCKKFYRVVLPYVGEKIGVGYQCNCGYKFEVQQKMASNNKCFIIKTNVKGE